MTQNEETIHRFYTAFAKKDYVTMQNCYHPDAVFSDPVFGLLDGNEVRAMWEMLCKNAKEFYLTYGDIVLLDEEYTTTNWTAIYRFAGTGRRVKNKLTSYMRFRDGLIAEHSDAFNLYGWTCQAFGIPGWIFGWSNFFQNRIRKKARENLNRFMHQ